MVSVHDDAIFERYQLTLGDFLSVFLLTRTGLSYFTSEVFGGIILFVSPSENLQLVEEKTKNLRRKFCCLGNITWTMVNKENLGTTSSHSFSLHVAGFLKTGATGSPNAVLANRKNWWQSRSRRDTWQVYVNRLWSDSNPFQNDL